MGTHVLKYGKGMRIVTKTSVKSIPATDLPGDDLKTYRF